VYNNPLQAYQNIDKSGMSGRDIEAYALTKAAVALRECQENWNSQERDQMLDQALKLNQRVWSIFQAELTMADNPLPLPIKQNILKLGAYIDKQALKIIAEPEREELDIIIAINENLAAGLRQKVEDEASIPSPNANYSPITAAPISTER
jgi:flagellar biosynthesis activator protein FlaF